MLLYGEQVAGALAFAVVWHRLMGQGPLERVVAMASGRARRAVMARPAQAHSEPGRGAEPSELKDDHTAETATTLTAVSSPARTADRPGERSHELASTTPTAIATPGVEITVASVAPGGDGGGIGQSPSPPGGHPKGGVAASKVVSNAEYVRFATHTGPDGLVRAANPESKGIAENLTGYANGI